MKTFCSFLAAFVFFTVLPLLSAAQLIGGVPPNQYAAYSIPDSLKKNADVVVREDAMHFVIKDLNNGLLECHEILTIMNEEGKDRLEFAQYSDKFQTLDEAEIKVYNAAGVKLNTYSKKEMQKVAYGEGLVEDGTVTYFNVSAPSYPITVEFIYAIKFRGLLDYPDASFQRVFSSVEHAVYQVEVPNELGLRYRVLNGKVREEIVPGKEKTTYLWEVKNLVMGKNEGHNGSSSRYFPRVLLAPNKFKLDNYEGDMSSWKSFGEWKAQLIGNSNQLSEKGKEFIKNLVKDGASDMDKARLVYNYLQQNMRYVSIQLGIGGFKPFPADFVQDKKYGDCKALSNYMRAALDAIGIRSYYAVVNSGVNAEPALVDFPSSPFNHIILCIPGTTDSTWLECTSKYTEFGELGASTENRNALLITERGGVLVPTPRSKAASNTLGVLTKIELAEDGSAAVQSTLRSQGQFRQVYIYYFNQRSDDEKRNSLVRQLEWKQPDQVSISNGSRFEKTFVTEAKMSYEQLPSFRAGSKMFVQPRLYPVFDEDVSDNDARTQDYYFHNPYEVRDTTIFHVPEGFGPESLPATKTIDLPFAAYSCQYGWDAGSRTVSVTTTLEIRRSQVKAAEYPKLVAFKNSVLQDMNEKLVIRKL